MDYFLRSTRLGFRCWRNEDLPLPMGLWGHSEATAAYELGIHNRRAFWGRGLAKEATQAIIGYAFGKLGAEALFAGHHPENEASRQLLLKLGFVHTHEELYPPTGLMHPSYLLRKP